MSREYDFRERLDRSLDPDTNSKIKDILLKLIPGALNAHPADKVNDLRGVDWWIEHRNSRHIGVDVKVRDVDYQIIEGRDDVALETWSVTEKQIVGWTRDESKLTEYVLWYWRDSGRYRIVPFLTLCGTFQHNWQSWIGDFKTRSQFTPRCIDGYHSECVFVPWDVLSAAMIEFSTVAKLDQSPQKPDDDGLEF